MNNAPGYWKSPWPGEDGGPSRLQIAPSINVRGKKAQVVSRMSIVSTMTVLRGPGEVFLLCHTGGDDAVSWVERIDPETLETIARSVDLVAGPTWPGGIAAHANGFLYVVFGRYIHQLSSELEVINSLELPRNRPYNSFVILDSGEIVLKDFGGARPGVPSTTRSVDCELLVIDPNSLTILDSYLLNEGSVSRLSSKGRDIYVVTMTQLVRLRWDGTSLQRDETFSATYVTEEGQEFAWDPVITKSDVWMLDNGAGSQNYTTSLLGIGDAKTSQKLIRVSLSDGSVTNYSVNDQVNSLVSNPPCIDEERQVAIGYDSAHGVVSAFAFANSSTPLWSKKLNHAMHPILLQEEGVVMMNDFRVETGLEDIVLLDVMSGEELHRVTTESPLQSVIFGSCGFSNDLYVCSFSHVSRISFTS